MKKAQRKARLKAIKANQKAARKAAVQTQEVPMSEQETNAPADREWLETAAAVASADLARAELRVADARIEARFMSDDRARELLTEAAELIREVIALGSQALKRIDPAQLADAIQIVDEPTRDELGAAVNRPRRGTNPVVTLLQVLYRAQSLLLRITRVTNPTLFRKLKAA